MASEEERRPLLSPAANDTEKEYGSAVNSENTDGSKLDKRKACTDGSPEGGADSVPFLIINPGRPVHGPSEISSSTLFESGEERFRLRRQQLEKERSSASRELRTRSLSSTSSQRVSLQWRHVHVHLERSTTLREKLGFDSDNDGDDTDSIESATSRATKRRKVILKNG